MISLPMTLCLGYLRSVFLEITKMGRRCSIATLDRSKFGEITKMVGGFFLSSYVSPTTHHQFSNPRHHRTWGCIPDIANGLGCHMLLRHMLQPSNSTRPKKPTAVTRWLRTCIPRCCKRTIFSWNYCSSWVLWCDRCATAPCRCCDLAS